MDNKYQDIQEGSLNFNAEELLNHIYDKYIEYYNNDNIKAQANFSSILSNIDSIKSRKINEIDHRINEFIDLLAMYSNKAENKSFYKNSLGIKSEDELRNQIDELEQLVEDFKCRANSIFGVGNTNKCFSEIVDKIKGIHNSVLITSINSKAIDKLLRIIHRHNDIRKVEINKRALNSVIDKMLELNYPEKLQYMENLSRKEQKDILPIKERNALTEHMINNIATDINDDGRGDYKYHHVKAYLETYYYDKSLRSVRRRRDAAVNKLKKEGKSHELLDNAGDNVLGNGTESSPGWQKKLDESLGEVK